MKSGLKGRAEPEHEARIRVATYAAMKSGLKDNRHRAFCTLEVVATYAAMKSGLKAKPKPLILPLRNL